MTAKTEPVTSRLAHPLKKLLQTLLGAYLFHHSPPSCKQTRKPGVGDQDLLVRCLYISLDFQETDFLSSVCLDWLCLFSEWPLFHKKIPWIETGYTRHLHIMASVWTACCCVNEKACTRIIICCVSNRNNWKKLSSHMSTGWNGSVHLSSLWLLTVMQIVMLLQNSEENFFSSDVPSSWRVTTYFACRILLFSLHTHISNMYLFSQRTTTSSYQLDISFYTLSLIYMMFSSPSSGMGSLRSTDQRRAPLRPGLANTERSRPDHLPTNRASPLSWGVLPVGCSFGDSHENHRALTEAKRISKEDERKTSAGQSFRGKVGHWIATCKRTFKPRIPPLNCHTCASLWQWSEEIEGTDKSSTSEFFLQLTLHDCCW